MKKLIFAIAVLFLASCGGTPEKPTSEVKSMLKNTTEKVANETKKATEKVADKVEKTADKVVAAFDADKAKALFTEKTCSACHQPDTKTVGPALKTIASTYNGEKGAIVKFLQGKGDVRIDKAQAAVMQGTIDNISSKMDAADLALLEGYIYSMK